MALCDHWMRNSRLWIVIFSALRSLFCLCRHHQHFCVQCMPLSIARLLHSETSVLLRSHGANGLFCNQRYLPSCTADQLSWTKYCAQLVLWSTTHHLLVSSKERGKCVITFFRSMSDIHLKNPQKATLGIYCIWRVCNLLGFHFSELKTFLIVLGSILGVD